MKDTEFKVTEEPCCWESFNVVSQKPFYGKLPMQSLQPGVYQHKKLYSENQVIGMMKAAYYDGYTDRQIEWEGQ